MQVMSPHLCACVSRLDCSLVVCRHLRARRRRSRRVPDRHDVGPHQTGTDQTGGQAMTGLTLTFCTSQCCRKSWRTQSVGVSRSCVERSAAIVAPIVHEMRLGARRSVLLAFLGIARPHLGLGQGLTMDHDRALAAGVIAVHLPRLLHSSSSSQHTDLTDLRQRTARTAVAGPEV